MAQGLVNLGKRLARRVRVLQRAETNTKKRWLVGFTAGISALVIFLWIAYFSFNFPDANASDQVADRATPSVWATFKNGLGVIGKDFGGKIGELQKSLNQNLANLRSAAQKTNNLVVEAPAEPAMPESVSATSSNL